MATVAENIAEEAIEPILRVGSGTQKGVKHRRRHRRGHGRRDRVPRQGVSRAPHLAARAAGEHRRV